MKPDARHGHSINLIAEAKVLLMIGGEILKTDNIKSVENIERKASNETWYFVLDTCKW